MTIRFSTRSRRIATALTLSASLSMVGMSALPAAAAKTPNQLVIGTLYASSGSFATSSISSYDGLKFWTATVDRQGGVYVKALHKKVKIVIKAYNDQSSATTAATLYNQLITMDKVNVLVSDFGSVLTSVAVPIAQEHHQLLFDVTGTGASFFTKSNPYLVLTSLPTSAIWPNSLADYLVKQKTKRVAVLYDTNDFDQSQYNTLVSRLKAAHITPVYTGGVPTSTTNYAIIDHAIAASNPQAVVEFGYPNNDIAFLQSLNANGVHFPKVFTIFPGQQLQLMQQNVGVSGLANTLTYPTPPLLQYNRVNFGMPLSAFEKQFPSVEHHPVDFLTVAGYNAGLIIQKTLETSPTLTQLGMRHAVNSFSGTLNTIDGQFKIDSTGAQIGERLPVGQLIKRGNGLAVKFLQH